MEHSLEELERVCKERGVKIKVLEERICELHERLGELDDLQSRYEANRSEFAALRRNYISLCGENQRLRQLLYHEKNKSFWKRLFNMD